MGDPVTNWEINSADPAKARKFYGDVFGWKMNFMPGVPVLKNGSFIKEEIGKLLTSPVNYHLHTDYHFGGYAKTDERLIEFIEQFVASTGILIEPVYTGKMLYALYDLAAKNYFGGSSRILAIHSGGIWGLLGMKDRFKNLPVPVKKNRFNR